MAIKNRTDLKSYFVRNAIPTEGNFADLIDSQLNQAQDGVFKPEGEPLSAVAAPGNQKRVLRLYANYPQANPDWMISLNPAQDPANAATTSRAGFGITDGTGNPRLFVDAGSGRVGMGTNDPQFALDVIGGARANGFRGRYDLVLNDYRTVNPASNVCLHSPAGDRDAWIYRDTADSGSNWGIYHRQINSPIADLPGNSIGFVGGFSSKLQAYVNLNDGSGFFAGGLSVQGNVTTPGFVGIGVSAPSHDYKLEVRGYSLLADPGCQFGSHFPFSDNNAYVTGNNVYLRGGSPTGGNKILTATSSGRVGINNDTPGAALDVRANSQVWNGWFEAIRLSQPDHSAITYPSGQLLFGMNSNRNFYFADTNAGRYVMTISGASGDVDIAGALTANSTISAPAGLIFEGSVAHIERDGAFYRNDGQCYLTVDDYFFIRDTNSSVWAALFNTNVGDLTIRGGLAAAHVQVYPTHRVWNGWYEAICLNNPTHSAITYPVGQLMFGMHNDRNFYFCDTNAGRNLMTISGASGNVSIPHGTLSASVKNFQINHPLDPQRLLVHSVVEGPEAAVFYRGESILVDGKCEIDLPSYFEALTRKENRTVLVTPKLSENEETSALAAGEVTDGRFLVRAIDGRNRKQRFYWEVKGVRADIGPIEVEPMKTDFTTHGTMP